MHISGENEKLSRRDIQGKFLPLKKMFKEWNRGEKRTMKFASQRIWQKPTDHSGNCYFCMVDPSNCRTGKNAFATMLPVLNSSIASVLLCHELSVYKVRDTGKDDIADPDEIFREAEERNPYYSNQKDLNNF
ncbi:hypothetical protein J437_LFUL013994 [Ladona fulva]|uniref:Uncharacterized protein n=1 Tax=Ladona fulva TaxID=123851 RepID=A0A8K0KG70_LADFU|nr:hypothetical protein J437_LFUL013994 [Ladona fulva]